MKWNCKGQWRSRRSFGSLENWIRVLEYHLGHGYPSFCLILSCTGRVLPMADFSFKVSSKMCSN